MVLVLSFRGPRTLTSWRIWFGLAAMVRVTEKFWGVLRLRRGGMGTAGSLVKVVRVLSFRGPEALACWRILFGLGGMVRVAEKFWGVLKLRRGRNAVKVRYGAHGAMERCGLSILNQTSPGGV